MTPGDVLGVLEVVASERPEVLPLVVATLAESPARSAVLELLPLFRAQEPAELPAEPKLLPDRPRGASVVHMEFIRPGHVSVLYEPPPAP